MKNNNYDDDDLRNRRYVDLKPIFYTKAVYNPDTDLYDLRPFIYVNTGDGTRADFIECPVKEKHRVQYKDRWERFVASSQMPRTQYSRDEMMNLQAFRIKYEYNKELVALPPDNPEYNKIISNFSLRLMPEDLFVLRQLDGATPDAPHQRSQDVNPTPTPAPQDKMDAVLVLLKDLTQQVGTLKQRVEEIENKQ